MPGSNDQGGILVLERIKHFLLYRTLSESNYQSVRIQILEENRIFAIRWSSVQMLYWLYCLIMTTREPDFLMCRHIYAMAMAACAAALFLAVFAVPRAHWLIVPVCLAVDIALLGAGIGIARLLAPKTIIIFASVLIVPVLFICDTLSTLVLFILNAAVFVAIGKNSMEPGAFQWTLTNLIVFSSVGIAIGYFINKARYERYVYSEFAVQLAESNAKLVKLQTRYANYDQMTGLQNRRAFAEKTDQFMVRMPSGCCVVMVDINGLKKMNDLFGHHAGDELIIGSAECLRQSFPGVDSIYRIGGDEFCVILTGRTENVEEYLKQLETTAGRWKGEYVTGISVSYGFATDEEFDDFDSMLKAADERMYAFKRNYYITSGHDRRHR